MHSKFIKYRIKELIMIVRNTFCIVYNQNVGQHSENSGTLLFILGYRNALRRSRGLQKLPNIQLDYVKQLLPNAVAKCVKHFKCFSCFV